MCGICGFSGAFGRDVLDQMIARLAHRGPDSAGHYFQEEKQVGLGHTRLSIIDLSDRGRQPMVSSSGRLILTYNGEIYNYQELKSRLLRDGYHFSSDTDSEVILAAYEKWGADCVRHFNGIFAFAIYDVARNEMCVARDPLGVKPLYYAETPRGVIFASELKAFAQVLEAKTPNLRAIAHYVTYLYAPSPMTMLEGVKKLKPGHYVMVRGPRIASEKQYYQIPFYRETLKGEEPELASELRSHLANAVERQLISDAPVGAFLSGGVDSSAVVAMARARSAGKKLRCFTIATDADASQREGFVSDLPYARKVAAHLDVELLTVDSDASQSNLEEMVYQLDEPQADPAALNVAYISKAARQLGIKVLLSGAGGDDLLTGYRRHTAIAMAEYWRSMPPEFAAFLSSVVSKLPARWAGTRRASRLVRSMQFEQIDDMIVSLFQWMKPETVVEALGGSASSEDLRESMLGTLRTLPSEADPIRRMLQLELKHFLCDHNLNYTDKMGMLHGIEIRVPFLDLHFVDFAMRLPSGVKQRRQTGKWIFKKAMEELLPQDVIWRPKAGFGVPLLEWMSGQFGESVRDYLEPATVRRRGLFKPEVIERMWREQESGRLDAAYFLVAMACIEAWMQKFVSRS